MQLVKWNPMRDIFSRPRFMSRMVDDFFSPFDVHNGEMSAWNWQPVVDVYDNDDRIIIKAELPGVDKKDIEIDVKNRILTLKGKRSSDHEVKEDNYVRRERFFGMFERTFTLPADVDAEKIQADYKDGVLNIDIPKPETQKPKQITVH